jgi:hypothetical protein
MTKTLIAIALGLSMPLVGAHAVRADPDECREAVHKYRSAENAVNAALPVYGDCVANSGGRDECENEFSTLQSAQENFEFAASNFKDDCH